MNFRLDSKDPRVTKIIQALVAHGFSIKKKDWGGSLINIIDEESDETRLKRSILKSIDDLFNEGSLVFPEGDEI